MVKRIKIFFTIFIITYISKLSIFAMNLYVKNKTKKELIEIKLISFGDFLINNKDRVAQMILVPVVKMNFEETDDLPETVRGEGGFGSTGK